jgi:hypothetical protein
MTPTRLAAYVLLTLVPLAGTARGQIIASAGFNDATGINSNPTANSPYNVANANLNGQGAGEPGWLSPWQSGGTATVVSAGAFDGDGAAFMQGTNQPIRVLAQPITGRTSVEALFLISSSAVTGNGINFYVRQASVPDTGGIGPQWQMRNDGRITVIDGNEDGDPAGLRVFDTGLTWTPGVYHRVRIDIDTATRRWGFSYDGTLVNRTFGYRGNPVFLDRVDYLNEINAPNGSFLDAVRAFPAPVPEPSSLALLGLAGCGAVPWVARRICQRRRGAPAAI